MANCADNGHIYEIADVCVFCKTPRPVSAPTPAAEEDGKQVHTPLPWKWDGDDLWHFGESYTDPIDPHRYTGISISRKLRDSPILAANMALILEAVNSIRTLTAERDAGVEKGIRMAAEAAQGWLEDSDVQRAILSLLPPTRIEKLEAGNGK